MILLPMSIYIGLSFQHFKNFRKSRSLNARINTFLSFFTHHWFIKVLKSSEKKYFWAIFWISSFSSFELQESSRKAKHKKFFSIVFPQMSFSRFFSRHFKFAIWSRNFILRHFNFAVELKKDFWRHFNFTDFRYLNRETAKFSWRETFLH